MKHYKIKKIKISHIRPYIKEVVLIKKPILPRKVFWKCNHSNLGDTRFKRSQPRF